VTGFEFMPRETKDHERGSGVQAGEGISLSNQTVANGRSRSSVDTEI
jgi:hypothetical protein